MYGNFSAHAGVIANNIGFSPNLITPKLNWDFGDVLVFDFFPFNLGNINDRPRINVWRDAAGEPDFNYLIYVSGGRDVLSPAPTGKLIQPWGDRRTGDYVFPTTSITYLKQKFSGINSGDNFGYSLDLNEDANVLVAGSPNDDSIFGTNAGAAYVYVGSPGAGGGWDLRQKITGQGSDSNFGTSVAISKNASTILVGGSGNDDGGQNAGLVFVFAGNKINGWTLRQRITGDNPTDLFGTSLAVNNDGTVLIIGGPSDNEAGSDAGGALIYTGNSSLGWNLKQKITGNINSGQYGFSLATNFDASIIAIGGPYDNTNASNAGGVLIYTGNRDNGWNLKQKLLGIHPSNNVFLTNSYYGTDISINNNGNLITVGAPRENAGGYNGGTVYIYSGNPTLGNWSLKQKLTGFSNNGYFGNSVSFDKNGETLMIGAPFELETGVAYGGLFLCTGSFNNDYEIENKIIGNKLNDQFGWKCKINNNSNVIITSATHEDRIENDNVGTFIAFNRATQQRKEIFAGIDLFTHSFARPIGINPPLSEWEITNKVPGETKYAYKFNLGEKTPQVYIKLAYNSNCLPVNIPTCNPNQNLVYIGNNANGCPRFECQDQFSERGELYITTSNWTGNAGRALFGKWSFISGLNSVRNISNSTQNGRSSIGNQSFFMLGSSGQLAAHTGTFILNKNSLLSGDSLSLDVNYSWNKGSRIISFITGSGANNRLFTVSHTNNDSLIFDRTSSNLGGSQSATITLGAFNQAFNYEVIHLGTGLRFIAKQYTSPTSTNILYSNTVNQIGQNFNVIKGLGISASLDNVPANDWGNYGVYFNNIVFVDQGALSSSSSSTPNQSCINQFGSRWDFVTQNNIVTVQNITNPDVRKTGYLKGADPLATDLGWQNIYGGLVIYDGPQSSGSTTGFRDGDIISFPAADPNLDIRLDRSKLYQVTVVPPPPVMNYPGSQALLVSCLSSSSSSSNLFTISMKMFTNSGTTSIEIPNIGEFSSDELNPTELLSDGISTARINQQDITFSNFSISEGFTYFKGSTTTGSSTLFNPTPPVSQVAITGVQIISQTSNTAFSGEFTLNNQTRLFRFGQNNLVFTGALNGNFTGKFRLIQSGATEFVWQRANTGIYLFTNNTDNPSDKRPPLNNPLAPYYEWLPWPNSGCNLPRVFETVYAPSFGTTNLVNPIFTGSGHCIGCPKIAINSEYINEANGFNVLNASPAGDFYKTFSLNSGNYNGSFHDRGLISIKYKISGSNFARVVVAFSCYCVPSPEIQGSTWEPSEGDVLAEINSPNYVSSLYWNMIQNQISPIYEQIGMVGLCDNGSSPVTIFDSCAVRNIDNEVIIPGPVPGMHIRGKDAYYIKYFAFVKKADNLPTDPNQIIRVNVLSAGVGVPKGLGGLKNGSTAGNYADNPPISIQDVSPLCQGKGWSLDGNSSDDINPRSLILRDDWGFGINISSYIFTGYNIRALKVRSGPGYSKFIDDEAKYYNLCNYKFTPWGGITCRINSQEDWQVFNLGWRAVGDSQNGYIIQVGGSSCVPGACLGCYECYEVPGPGMVLELPNWNTYTGEGTIVNVHPARLAAYGERGIAERIYYENSFLKGSGKRGQGIIEAYIRTDAQSNWWNKTSVSNYVIPEGAFQKNKLLEPKYRGWPSSDNLGGEHYLRVKQPEGYRVPDYKTVMNAGYIEETYIMGEGLFHIHPYYYIDRHQVFDPLIGQNVDADYTDINVLFKNYLWNISQNNNMDDISVPSGTPCPPPLLTGCPVDHFRSGIINISGCPDYICIPYINLEGFPTGSWKVTDIEIDPISFNPITFNLLVGNQIGIGTNNSLTMIISGGCNTYTGSGTINITKQMSITGIRSGQNYQSCSSRNLMIERGFTGLLSSAKNWKYYKIDANSVPTLELIDISGVTVANAEPLGIIPPPPPPPSPFVKLETIAMNGYYNGNIQYTAGLNSYLYLSTSHWFNWSSELTDTPRNWKDIAIDGNGNSIYAVPDSGFIYVDSFQTSWIPRLTDIGRRWSSIATNQSISQGINDGFYVTALEKSGSIYVSDDRGENWTQKSIIRDWSDIAISENGRFQIASSLNSRLFFSNNTGVTWSERLTSTVGMKAVGMSNNGAIQIAVGEPGAFISYNTGVGAWINLSTTTNLFDNEWVDVAISAQGSRIYLLPRLGFIHYSFTSGQSWLRSYLNKNWYKISMSKDGTKISAITRDGDIFISNDGLTWAPRYPTPTAPIQNII